MNGEPGKGIQNGQFKPEIEAQPAPRQKVTNLQIIKAWWALQVQGYTNWRSLRRFKRNQHVFYTLLKDKRSGLEDVVTKHGQLIGKTLMMEFLDKKGYVHCAFCQETEPLRVYLGDGDAFTVCPGHFEALKGGARVVKVPAGADK